MTVNGGWAMRTTRLSVILLATSACLAILAAVIVQADIRKAEDAAAASIKTVPVLVATQAIAAHRPLVSGDFTVLRVPAGGRTKGALISPLQVSGLVTTQSLYTGEQILPGMLVAASMSQRMADRIPAGMLAISVGYNPVSDAGGSLQPGDKVAILAVLGKSYAGSRRDEARIVANDILVLSTPVPNLQATSTSQGAAPGQADTVLLAVSPQTADAIAYVTVYGELSLLLEPSSGAVPGMSSPIVSSENALVNP